MSRLIDADLLKAGFEEDGHLSPYIEGFIDACPTVETGQKWIGVKDRLPESTDLYLVNAVHRYNKADGYRSVQVRLYFKDEDEWHGLPDLYEITHWMPLPEAPKEE